MNIIILEYLDETHFHSFADSHCEKFVLFLYKSIDESSSDDTVKFSSLNLLNATRALMVEKTIDYRRFKLKYKDKIYDFDEDSNIVCDEKGFPNFEKYSNETFIRRILKARIANG